MWKKFGCLKTHSLFIVGISTLMEKERAKVLKYTKTVTNTKANGITTYPTAKAISGIKMATITSESGPMEKLTDKVSIRHTMDLLTVDSGKMIFSKDSGRRLGLISHFLRGHTIWELSTVKENTSTLMDQFTKATGAIIKFQVKEFTLGLIRNPMRVNGLITICTVMVFSHGPMVEDTKATILMIKNMDLVFILGVMVENMLDSGRMDSSTDKVFTRMLMVLKELAFGKKEKE